MKQIKAYIYILIKKTVSQKAFVALAVLIPIVGLCLFLSSNNSSESDSKIYLFSESEDEFSKAVFNSLIDDDNGNNFVIASSADEIEKAVSTNRALCGYILVKAQPALIAAGKTNGNIILVERMGDGKTDTVNEIFFSHYFREYTKCFSKSYTNNEAVFNKSFESLMESSLKSYTVNTLSSRDEKQSNDTARNILAVILCLFSMLNMTSFITDRERGILIPVPAKLRTLFRFIYFSTPLILIFPVSFISVVLFNNKHGVLAEALYLLLYELLLIILCVLFSYILKHRIVMFGIIPVFTLLYIIVCPVFIDLSSYLPIINILRYFCPPYFYMGL